MITKSREVTYVTQCYPVEVLTRVSLSFTKEIPMTWNNTSYFVNNPCRLRRKSLKEIHVVRQDSSEPVFSGVILSRRHIVFPSKIILIVHGYDA